MDPWRTLALIEYSFRPEPLETNYYLEKKKYDQISDLKLHKT